MCIPSDQQLYCRIGNAKSVKDSVQIIRDETVSGPLREEGDGDGDDHTLPIAGGGIESGPADISGHSAVELYTGLDLVELEEDKRVCFIAVSVIMGQDLEGLRLSALGHEPTRRFRSEQNEEELEDRGETLKDRGNTPCPVVVDELCAKCCPRGTTQ